VSMHRYSFAALRGDYARAALGLALTVGLAALAGGEPVSTAILLGAALIFLAFGMRTWLRQRTTVEVGEKGISTSGGRYVNLPWAELSALKLRYYATKRDRTGGWMQLTLAAGRSRLSLESSLDGFVELVRRAVLAANVNDLTLDSSTRNNLLALGIVPPAAPA